MRKCTLACMAKGVVLAFGVLLAGLPGYAAPELVYQAFDPPVIKVDGTGPVVYQVKASGHLTRVVLELNDPSGGAEERALHDDGLDGNRQAGDGVYSVSLSTVEIVRLLRLNDAFRVEVGFVILYQGSREATRGNVFADVLTEDIPRLPVTRLAPDVQYTDYLVNIVDPDFVTATAYDIPSVTRRSYQLFPDDFDFLSLISFPSYFRNRFHFQVKNEVRGIGVRPSTTRRATEARGDSWESPYSPCLHCLTEPVLGTSTSWGINRSTTSISRRLTTETLIGRFRTSRADSWAILTQSHAKASASPLWSGQAQRDW